MGFSHFIGIDVSKNSLSISLRDSTKELFYCEVDNNPKSIIRLINNLRKEVVDFSQLLVCLEHTGVYSYHALYTFHESGFNVWIEHALNIKNSLGMQRGKNDRVDASRIADYAFRFQDKHVLWEPEREEISQLKKLYQLRESLINTRKQLKLSEKQSVGFEDKTLSKLAHSIYKPVIDKINKQLTEVNNQIRRLLNSDKRLKELKRLVCSVTGVGEVIAWKMIITTNEFKSFSDGRKYACYSGVVPFEHQSGTSLRGRSRVSQMANKQIKSLFHMAAIAVVSRGKGELFEYFERKVSEGKSKMSVLNAMKNKIIQRVFACVRDSREYQDFKLA